MKRIFFLIGFMAILSGVNAQKFDMDTAWYSNGPHSSKVNVRGDGAFSIKKDAQKTWAYYEVHQKCVTVGVKENSTSVLRTCEFVLLDGNGKAVDTLFILQDGKPKTTITRNSTATTSSSSRQTTAKSKTTSQSSYNGQCCATTKKGRRCSRRASGGSRYCWQHQR